MKGPITFLIFAGLVLAWVVLFSAGVQPVNRNSALLLLGTVSFIYWPYRSGQTAPPLKVWHAAALVALPCYLIFQVISLPTGIIAELSPASATLTNSLASVVPNISSATISVARAASIFCAFGFLGYIGTFLLVRDIAWRYTETRNWMAAFPLVGVAAIEALVALYQSFSNTTGLSVIGTFPDRDHLSAFLEMALPFSLVCGYDAFRRHRSHGQDSSKAAIIACVLWGISALMFIAILESGSRAAPLVLCASLFIPFVLLSAKYVKTKRGRLISAGILLSCAITFFIIYPPDQMPYLIADLAASDKTPDEQMSLWKEAIPILSEFRWFGTGLGGFESVFLKYQGAVSGLRIEYANNDYLNYLVELGLVGFAILAVACFGVIRSTVRGAIFLTEEPRRLLTTAGVGSLIAIAIRSTVGSNMAVPANAFALAWILGTLSANGLE